jgi:DNA invertase Pin-like site-specific DNA recombinase
MLWAGLYARVSTNDQQTLAMQNRALREYAACRDWRKLHRTGLSKSEIARRLKIGRTSVRRLLG